MCQNNAVVTVVDGFVSKGFMFTAFDVTKFLRASGNQIHHSDVNTAVKQMFRHGEITGYDRAVKDIGAPVAPFVYFHPNSDVDKYSPDWIDNDPTQDNMKNDVNDGASTVAGVAQPTASSYGKVTPVKATHTVKASLPKGVQGVDKEGRLYIAPVVTQSAGLLPKQTVWIVTDNSTKLVINTKTSSGAWGVTVNSDGRIRVCRSVLSKLGAAMGYKVSAGHGNIEIVPA